MRFLYRKSLFKNVFDHNFQFICQLILFFFLLHILRQKANTMDILETIAALDLKTKGVNEGM